MIAALLLAATSMQGSVRTIDLSRGASIPASDASQPAMTYWAESDTFLDSAGANQNFAGEPVIGAGPAKTVLVRFGDLDRVAAGMRHVRKATLILTIAGGDKPKLKSVGRVLVPWNAGPYFTLNALINRSEKDLGDDAPKKPAAPDDSNTAARWSATWKQRFAGEGGANWQQAGANGPEDAADVTEAQAVVTDKTVAIDDVTSAVQAMLDHPAENYGFALHFQNECEFFSCRGAIGRPVLHLELDEAPPSQGPDLSVTTIERTALTGSDATYAAHVKNVGTEPSGACSAVWVADGKAGQPVEVAALAPGKEAILVTHFALRADKTDHRTQTLALKLIPKGPDANPANNELVVYPGGQQIDVVIPQAMTQGANLIGSKSVEDWVQAQVRVFNDVYLAESRFSFAPDGAKERVSVGRIVTDPSAAAAAVPSGESNWLGSDPVFMRSIGLAAGLPNYSSMNYRFGERVELKDGGKAISTGSLDLFPGVMGYGDTRYEGTLPGRVSMQYGPYPGPVGTLPMVPTGLLSATDVAFVNSRIEHPDVQLPMPKTTLVSVMDISGRPLNNTQLEFFQSVGGKIPDGPPTFTVSTGETAGSALLPSKEGLGPFGKLDKDGGNGTFLVRATANGTTDFAWLKAWQVIDTASRGNNLAGVVDMRFNLPTAALDASSDLARDRIISDSTNQLPAHLAPLLSDAAGITVDLGGKAGDWVEIDLGRDRTIGEISLIADPGAFWPQFDVMVYITGQKPDEATVWTKELNWGWTSANRCSAAPNDPKAVSVGYCAPASRIRFIRIINRSNSVGKLKGIRVTPAKVSS